MMAAEPAAIATAHRAWQDAMGAFDDHTALCCGRPGYRSCPTGTRLEQAEDQAWHRYFQSRYPEGR